MNQIDFDFLEDRKPLESVAVDGATLKPGDRVRLKPRRGGDVFDSFLAGQTAVIESIEEDYEGKIHVAVVADNDPGKDLGLLRQTAHRFFFAIDEIEIE
jgi:hypothetical protein